MCCVAEIAMLIFGIITLAKGKLTVTSSKVVYGAPARVIGVILMLPLPLALVVGFLIGFTMAAQGKPAEGKDMLKFAPIDLGLVIAALLASLGIALATAERPRRKRRPAFEDEYEEEYEERPRRRRRRDEDEDDFGEEHGQGPADNPPPQQPDDQFRAK